MTFSSWKHFSRNIRRTRIQSKQTTAVGRVPLHKSFLALSRAYRANQPKHRDRGSPLDRGEDNPARDGGSKPTRDPRASSQPPAVPYFLHGGKGPVLRTGNGFGEGLWSAESAANRKQTIGHPTERDERLLCSALWQVPRARDSWKRRSSGTTPCSASRFEYRRRQYPNKIVTGEGFNDELTLSKAAGATRVSRPVFCTFPQALPGHMRVSTAPSRHMFGNFQFGVDRTPALVGGSPPLGQAKETVDGTREESSTMCFGRYRLIED